MPKEISIIIPLNNEARCCIYLYSQLKKVLASINKEYEIVFVDDGSIDGTSNVLYKIYNSDRNNVCILRLDRNYGQTTALAAGIDFARGDIILTMDGDLQHDPGDVPRFLEKIYAGYKVVNGWRRNRTDDFLTKRLPSFIINIAVRLIFNIKLNDISSTYRAYDKNVIKNIKLSSGFHRFIPLLFHNDKTSIYEIEIKCNSRKFGKTHYGLNRISTVIKDIVLLWIKRWKKSVAIAPLNYSILEIKSGNPDNH